MAIEPIKNNVPIQYVQQQPQNSSQNSNTSEPVDAEKSNAAKYMIGATTLATVIGLGIYAGYKGKLGKNIQKLLGGTEKAVGNENKNLKLDNKTLSEYLPNPKSFEISSKVGATVNETIENVFGKNSNITPHTYDISKEFDSIAIQRNHGGYKDGIATTKGTIQNSIKGTTGGIRAASTSHALISFKNNTTHLALEDGTRITSGTVPNYKNKIVQLEIPDGDKTFKIKFAFISPNDEFTPLQKDILKLAEHPGKINHELLKTLTQFKPAHTPDGAIDFENVGQYANLDYDLLLSVFQSMANKV